MLQILLLVRPGCVAPGVLVKSGMLSAKVVAENNNPASNNTLYKLVIKISSGTNPVHKVG